jgi:hypothetical protein
VYLSADYVARLRVHDVKFLRWRLSASKSGEHRVLVLVLVLVLAYSC